MSLDSMPKIVEGPKVPIHVIREEEIFVYPEGQKMDRFLQKKSKFRRILFYHRTDKGEWMQLVGGDLVLTNQDEHIQLEELYQESKR